MRSRANSQKHFFIAIDGQHFVASGRIFFSVAFSKFDFFKKFFLLKN
jgi:hypothetical protein